MELAGRPDPRACIMLDDSISNLQPARELGFTTILVGPNSLSEDGDHLKITGVKALPLAMPELWDHPGETRAG